MRHRHAEGDDAVLVEVGEGLGPAELLEIGRRGVEVHVHREQLPLDQVGLGRLAQADGDVRLRMPRSSSSSSRISCSLMSG